jgi:hypothetical protein
MQLTDLLREHIPLELGQIFHRPNIISPSTAFLPTYRLRI